LPDGDGGENAADPVSFGPWSQQATQVSTLQVGGEPRYIISDTCVSLPDGTEVDAYLKTVRAFSIIAPIIGGILTVGLWLAPCFYRFSAGTWSCLAVMFIVVLPLFQGLTFLIYSSSLCTDNSVLAASGVSEYYSSECQWDEGSSTNAASVVLYFLTGIVMLLNGHPKRPPTPPPETQEVTYQRTTNPNGTTTVAEVAVVKGTAVPPPPTLEEAAK